MPSEWQEFSLGQLAQFINGRAFKPYEWGTHGLSIVRIEQMTNPLAASDKFSGSYSQQHFITSGTLIFSWSATLSVQIWQRGDAVLNQHIFKVVPNGLVDAGYFYHSLKSAVSEMALHTHGSTMQHLKRTDILPFKVQVPPLPEQRRIAEILDTLDRTIETTQRIIEKLQATRQGLLHDLLTRGLDENGQLRDPERNPELFRETDLGRLPRGWEVQTLGNVCSLIKDGTHLPPKRVAAGPLLLSVQNMVRGQFVLTADDTHVPWEFYRQMHATWEIKPGDALLAIVGATLGKTAIVPENLPPFTLQRSVAVLRGSDNRLNSTFLRTWLQTPTFQRSLWAGANQTAQPGIYLNQLASMSIPLPSLAEQEKIVMLEQQASDSITSEQAKLSKLQALKRGLMEDLLTGRVRVPLPEQQVIHDHQHGDKGAVHAPIPTPMQEPEPVRVPYIPDLPTPQPSAMFRVAAGANPQAMTEWTRQIVEHVRGQQVGAYSSEALDAVLPELLALAANREGIQRVPEVLAKAGIRFMLLPHTSKSKANGAAFYLDEERTQPVVGLSLRYPTLDVFWFNLLHELAHIRLGHSPVPDESLEQYDNASSDEQEANRWAQDKLIPPLEWQAFYAKHPVSNQQIYALARKLGRHVSIVAGRYGHEAGGLTNFMREGVKPASSRLPGA